MGIGAGTAALIGGGLAAAGTVASSVIGSGAASDAANAQTQAANTAAQTQLAMYNQTRADLSPFATAGHNAFSQLANIFGYGGTTSNAGAVGTTSPLTNGIGVLSPSSGGAGNGATTAGQPNPALATQLLSQFPGYQFGLDQGQQALDRSAASRGLVLSGAQLKDSQTFGNNYAMQNAWNPYISQLTSAASLGENAAAQTGNIGASAASGIANSQLAAGQSTASGIVGSANQLTSGLNQLGTNISPLLSSYGGIGGIYSNVYGSNAGNYSGGYGQIASATPLSFTTPNLGDINSIPLGG